MTSGALVPDMDAQLILSLICVLLTPLAPAGLLLVNTGLGRSRNAAHMVLSSVAVCGVAVVAYFVCGLAIQSFSGAAAHSVMIEGKAWNLIGGGSFFFLDLRDGNVRKPVIALFQMFCVMTAAIIPLGAAEERWKLSASFVSTALLSGLIYPLFAHWVWGGGWLSQLGLNYGMGRGFLDAGGSGTIQCLGGVAGLAMTWLLGPRHGKYSADGMPSAIPGHNIVYALFGCALALVGWVALNSAGALLFYDVAAGHVATIAINTILCCMFSLLSTGAITRWRFGKPDASLCANGFIGGLVASSASCAWVSPTSAAFIGMVTGVIVPYSVEIFELRLAVDDPGGSVSVHALSGIWGLMAVAFLGNTRTATTPSSGQWLAQLIGVATLIGFVLPLCYGLNWLLDRFVPQRVARDAERYGLDIHELGAGAYPDFVTHSDDFMQR